MDDFKSSIYYLFIFIFHFLLNIIIKNYTSRTGQFDNNDNDYLED